MIKKETLTILETPGRSLKYINIIDRGGNKIRVQQSSARLSDVWLFVDEKSPFVDHVLLTPDNVKTINAFVRYLETK